MDTKKGCKIEILQALSIAVEAATGFEPVNDGFADRCPYQLGYAAPPYFLMERETGLEPATITLAT